MSTRDCGVLIGHRHPGHVVMSGDCAVRMLMSAIAHIRDRLRRDEDRVRAIDCGALYGNRAQPEQHQQDCDTNNGT